MERELGVSSKSLRRRKMYELEDQIEAERSGMRLGRARGRDGGLFIYRAGRRPQSVARAQSTGTEDMRVSQH
jgi:hypothetical protein